MSHELQRQTSALQRNKAFCTGLDSLPVNSRPYARTDNYNFSTRDNVVTSVERASAEYILYTKRILNMCMHVVGQLAT